MTSENDAGIASTPRYRWRLQNAVAAVAVTLALIPSRALALAPDPGLGPVPLVATWYEQLFTRVNQPYGMTLADGAVSVRLSNGKDAWFFGDSNTGVMSNTGNHTSATVNGDLIQPAWAAAPSFYWLRNQVVVTNGVSSFTTHYGPLKAVNPAPSKLPTDYFGTSDGTFIWPGTAHVEGDNVLVFTRHFSGVPVVYRYQEIQVVPQSTFSGAPATDRLFATIPVPDTMVTINGFTCPIVWGHVTLNSTDGNTYIYGVRTCNGFSKTFLARSAIGQLTQVSSWKYWTGASSGWSSNSAQSAVIWDNHAVTEVVESGGRFIFFDSHGKQLRAYVASHPYGRPSGNLSGGFYEQNVGLEWTYSMPELYDDRYIKSDGVTTKLQGYLPHVHKGVVNSGNTKLQLFSYCINTAFGEPRAQPETYYRPHFIWLDIPAIAALKDDIN